MYLNPGKKKQHSQCFISTESVLQQLIYSSLMCSVSSYLKHSELKALFFGLAGSFSISNPFILKLEIKILTFTRWKYQLFSSYRKTSKLWFAEFESKCFRCGFSWPYFAYNFLVPYVHCRHCVLILYCFILSFFLLSYSVSLARLNFYWCALVIYLSTCTDTQFKGNYHFVQNCSFYGVPDYLCCLPVSTTGFRWLNQMAKALSWICTQDMSFIYQSR